MDKSRQIRVRLPHVTIHIRTPHRRSALAVVVVVDLKHSRTVSEWQCRSSWLDNKHKGEQDFYYYHWGWWARMFVAPCFICGPPHKYCESVAVTAPLSTSHSVTPSSASELVLRRSFVRFRPFTVSKLWILFIWWMEAVAQLDYLVFVDTRIGDVAMWWARTDAQKVTPSVFVCSYIRSRFKVSSGWLVANTHSRIDSKVA